MLAHSLVELAVAERGEVVLDEELGHAHPLLAGDAVRHAALPIVCPPASRQSASLPARAPAQHVQSAELEFERSPLMKFQTRVLSGARPVMKLLRLAEQIPKFVSAQTPPGVSSVSGRGARHPSHSAGPELGSRSGESERLTGVVEGERLVRELVKGGRVHELLAVGLVQLRPQVAAHTSTIISARRWPSSGAEREGRTLR